MTTLPIHRTPEGHHIIGDPCEGVWVGLFGRETPCSNRGIIKVNAEHLCIAHSEDIPTSDEMDYRDCPLCRAKRGMPHRPGYRGAYYWCPGCNTEWREPGRYPSMYRTHPLDLTFGILRVLYTLGLFIVLTVLFARWLEPEYLHLDHDQRILATWGGAGMALIPTALGSVLINEILRGTAYGLALAARYVLGGPIVKGGQPQ
jgi:hypothetical protein